MQPIHRLGGDAERGIEAEGDVGARHIVVDRLGQRDDIEAGLLEPERILLGAAAANANQRVQLVAMVGIQDGVRHVADFAIDDHFVGLVAAGAEDRAAIGEDARQHAGFELHGFVADQAAKAIAETGEPHVIRIATRAANPANGRIQPGTITAARQNSNVPGHVFENV